MLAAERTKNMLKELQHARGGSQSSGLSRLEVPKNPDEKTFKQCKEWITIDTPKDIEEKLLSRNQTHFGQAHGSFPRIPPFSEWIDWSASTHQAELILDGNFTPPDLEELAQDLIRHMEKRTQLYSQKEEITAEEWIQKIKILSENTTTSPSGFHLTNSKALVATHDLILTSEAGTLLESKR